MSGLAECRREAEVVAAVSSGRWPAAVDGALVEHVRTCAVCAEVLEVAQVMAPLERETLAEARIPSPGRLRMVIKPRWRLTMCLTMARPSPVPFFLRLDSASTR